MGLEDGQEDMEELVQEGADAGGCSDGGDAKRGCVRVDWLGQRERKGAASTDGGRMDIALGIK